MSPEPKVCPKKLTSKRSPYAMVESIWSDDDAAVFPSLADVIPQPVSRSGRALNVCIMTTDFVGPVRNGGIGTAYRYVADFLVEQGHKVTVLYGPGQNCEIENIDYWVEYYSKRDINFVPMPEADVPVFKNGPLGRAMRISYCAYEWLKDKSFDLVHVSECGGMGYASILAKKLGLHFQDTLFAVKCSSPLVWSLLGASASMKRPEELLFAFMEQRSVELGDIIISGSSHLLRWMLQNGYKLDCKRCFVQPNIMLASTMPVFGDNTNCKGDRVAIKEVVFFGSLEPRKGIHVFCNAISRMINSGIKPGKITFLGKFSKHFDAKEFIHKQSANWGVETRIIDDFNQPQAIEYLNSDNRLAVIPSLVENSSFVIYECLTYAIPFLASDRGGNPELIHEDDHADILFDAHPKDLAQSIRTVLENGALVARPSFNNEDNLKIWQDWHNSLREQGRIKHLSGACKPLGAQAPKPLVTVCLAHYERPDLVWQAIESIEQQTYDNLEVVMVDDGSPSPETQEKLDSIEAYFTSKGWRLVRQENLYLGASRNTAARNAKGEYLLFMDDDNLAKPHEIETFVDVATRGDFDLLTCYSDAFHGLDKPQQSAFRITPVGPNIPFGFGWNGFGDSNFFIKKSVFDSIGGFGEDFRVGRDDQEFLARAAFSGCKFEVVPEALFWYRQPFGSGMKEMNFSQESGQMRVVKTYISYAPLAFRNMFHYMIHLINLVEELSRSRNQFRDESRNSKARLEASESIAAGMVFFLALNAKNFSAKLHGDYINPDCRGGMQLGKGAPEPVISGWLWDRNNRERILHLLVMKNGKFACCLRADVLIEKYNYPTRGLGSHGYQIPLSFLKLKDGDCLRGFILETGAVMNGTPCRFSAGELVKDDAAGAQEEWASVMAMIETRADA